MNMNMVIIPRAQFGQLLTRDEFRKAVFERDGMRCVVCGTWPHENVYVTNLDAHHVLERRLFPDGGYYLDNGATVCSGDMPGGGCHMQAEQTTISCDELREKAGITTVILPPHLYKDQPYDKWGNPILPDGRRLRGELFDDESVQKVLASVLHLFTDRVKYPRTYHLPWSPGATDDDRLVEDVEAMFAGKEVVVTEKMDGENTTMYRDYIHARSLDYSPHDSRDRVKAMWAAVAHDIPEGWRVCGENLYAEHSIHYPDLYSYFQVFSVWNEKNVCLPWDETKEWAALLGFSTVRVLTRGVWGAPASVAVPWRKLDRAWIEDAWKCHTEPDLNEAPRETEGYVVRLAGEFHYKDFRKSVAKYVRAGHVVHREGHWSNRRVVPNGLIKGK